LLKFQFGQLFRIIDISCYKTPIEMILKCHESSRSEL